jgi:hypothetical protein
MNKLEKIIIKYFKKNTLIDRGHAEEYATDLAKMFFNYNKKVLITDEKILNTVDKLIKENTEFKRDNECLEEQVKRLAGVIKNGNAVCNNLGIDLSKL